MTQRGQRDGIPRIDVREFLDEGGAAMRRNNKMLFPLNSPNYYFIQREDLRTLTYEANIIKAGRSKIKLYASKSGRDDAAQDTSRKFFAAKPVSSQIGYRHRRFDERLYAEVDRKTFHKTKISNFS